MNMRNLYASATSLRDNTIPSNPKPFKFEEGKIHTYTWLGSLDFKTARTTLSGLGSMLPAAPCDFKKNWLTQNPIAWNANNLYTPATLRDAGFNVLLTIGGSLASPQGWMDMVNAGVDNNVALLSDMCAQRGLVGIDWDLEILPTPATCDNLQFWDWLAQVNTKLREYKWVVALTMSGDPLMSSGNPPGEKNDYFQKNADSFDFVNVMLYGSQMWTLNENGAIMSWCGYADKVRESYPALESKLFYGITVMTQGGTGSACCEACINEALEMITQNKYGIGVAIWCYAASDDSYLPCGDRSVTSKVIEKVASALSRGEKTLTSDVWKGNCYGPLQFKGCGPEATSTLSYAVNTIPTNCSNIPSSTPSPCLPPFSLPPATPVTPLPPIHPASHSSPSSSPTSNKTILSLLFILLIICFVGFLIAMLIG